MDLKLEGEFQIADWNENIYHQGEGDARQSHAVIKQTYQGDIQASSDLHYLMSYQEAKSAVFVGHERIDGRFGDHNGSLVLQHIGVFEGGVASSRFTVVPGSATGDLAGSLGSGTFESNQGGKARYHLTLHK